MEGIEEKPKVSVCVVTYNHEKYIAECLQSIVDQETNFDFEVIVGDDCSTDRTREVVQAYVEKYPGKIRTLLHGKNVGAAQNYYSVHNQAKGEYIAHLDGDDYWMQNKLQYQVGLLDEKPHLVFVADYVGGNQELDTEVVEFSAAELFKKNNPCTHSSKLYRAAGIADNFGEVECLDIEIHMRQLGATGLCGLTRKKTTIYRENSDSSIRRFVNDKIVNIYIQLFDFALSIGISKLEVDGIYDYFIKSSLKLAACTNDSNGVKVISGAINSSPYKLRNITKLYSLLVQNNLGMASLRCALSVKRIFVNFYNMLVQSISRKQYSSFI